MGSGRRYRMARGSDKGPLDQVGLAIEHERRLCRIGLDERRVPLRKSGRSGQLLPSPLGVVLGGGDGGNGSGVERGKYAGVKVKVHTAVHVQRAVAPQVRLGGASPQRRERFGDIWVEVLLEHGAASVVVVEAVRPVWVVFEYGAHGPPRTRADTRRLVRLIQDPRHAWLRLAARGLLTVHLRLHLVGCHDVQRLAVCIERGVFVADGLEHVGHAQPRQLALTHATSE